MSFLNWITSTFASLFAGLGWIVVGAAVIAAILVHVFGKVLPSWVPAAVIAALGLAFVGNNVLKTEQLRTEQMAHLATKQQHAAVLQGIAAKTAAAHRQALAAERAVTANEAALRETIHQKDQEAIHAKREHDKRVAAADAVGERLRNQLARVSQRYASACAKADAAAATAGVRTSEACAVGVLADLLGKEQHRARTYAAEADEARAAGLTCERAYDAARQALGQRGGKYGF